MSRIPLLGLIAMATLATAQSNVPSTPPDATTLKKMTARFELVEMAVDTSHLSPGDKAAVVKLLEAAKIIDTLQLRQRWSKNEKLLAALKADTSPISRARLEYFLINKGPWDHLGGNKSFMGAFAGITPPAAYPEGGNFYPEDATKEELEAWMKSLPGKQRDEAQWFFTTIRRGPGKKLKTVKYSDEYKPDLVKLAGLLREAAALTTNASLKKFLTLRADAFLSNDYYDSDIAWMELDSPIDVTIGPYETYNDELFGYKAAFEAYVTVRDEADSAKLKFLSSHMQEIEDHLPIPAEFRNPKVGAAAPMVVVNSIIGTGDGNMGIQTVAYNLPNDERIISQRGSKRIMLKNVQRAKFKATLAPISRRVLAGDAAKDVDFDFFFTHTIAHEITHGLGPHVLKVGGKETTPRQALKELYSSFEEAKADATGLFALQYLIEKGLMKDSLGQGEAAERKLYNTMLASTFRTLHFGLTDAHARGMAMQVNFLLDAGGYVANSDGTFSVDFSKIKKAVADLDNALLMAEAHGDYAQAKAMYDRLMKVRPEVQKALDKLNDLPNDIRPGYVTARDLEHGAAAKAKK